MKKRRRDWGPRRVLDATTRQVMVGNDAIEAAAPLTPPSDQRTGSVSHLDGKEGA
jgi:hypothetical protein